MNALLCWSSACRIKGSKARKILPDVTKGLAVLGEREEALGRDWLLPVAPAVTTRDMLRIIGEVIGQPPQIINVLTIEQAQERGVFDETFVREYAELFYQYIEPQVVDASAFEQAFNLHATPLDEAIHTTVRWYREHTGA